MALRDHLARSRQEILGGTIIFSKRKRRCPGEVLRKTFKEFHIASAEPVDRLIRISDRRDLHTALRQAQQKRVLRGIDILIFVDKNVAIYILQIPTQL